MSSLARKARKPKVFNLDDLARQINAAHAEVKAAILSGVEKAVNVGQLLIKAKALVSHGQWESWVESNTAVTPRACSGYMRAARNWEQSDEANRKRVSDLSLRAFLGEMASPSFQLPPPESSSEKTTTHVNDHGSETADNAQERRTITAEDAKAHMRRNAAWFNADREKLDRRFIRIRNKLTGPTQAQIERQIDEAVLSSTEANYLASLRLFGRGDLEMVVRVSKLDENVNLEELAGFFSDAAVQALK